MQRTCDGKDPNLTRHLPEDDYDAGTMVLAPGNSLADPGEVIICCACGLAFDDVYRRVVWPHEYLGQGTLL